MVLVNKQQIDEQTKIKSTHKKKTDVSMENLVYNKCHYKSVGKNSLFHKWYWDNVTHVRSIQISASYCNFQRDQRPSGDPSEEIGGEYIVTLCCKYFLKQGFKKKTSK